MTSATQTVVQQGFPWGGQPDDIACDGAYRNLIEHLPAHMSIDGRIHVETLMTAAGSIAGFCAHVSLVSDAAALKAAQDAGTLGLVKLKNGGEVLLGDTLNRMLCATTADLAPQRVWNTLAGAALANGAAAEALPDLDGMFERVARSLTTDREGFPSVPAQNQPQLSAREALQIAGPFAVQCLTGRYGLASGQADLHVAETSWVGVGAQAAAAMVGRVKPVLKPEIAVQIAMEAAIYISKMRPGILRADALAQA